MLVPRFGLGRYSLRDYVQKRDGAKKRRIRIEMFTQLLRSHPRLILSRRVHAALELLHAASSL